MHRTAAGFVAATLLLEASGCGGSSTLRGKTDTELAAKMLVYQRAKVAGIGNLTPPARLQARYDQYTSALAARLRLFERSDAAVRAGETSRAFEAHGTQLQRQESKRALALGLRACRE
jgi:hypothetical protein